MDSKPNCNTILHILCFYFESWLFL